MEGSCRSPQDRLPVERSFEVSRLEQQLLASAYELAVPVITRSLPGRKTAAQKPHGSVTDSESPLAKGA